MLMNKQRLNLTSIISGLFFAGLSLSAPIASAENAIQVESCKASFNQLGAHYKIVSQRTATSKHHDGHGDTDHHSNEKNQTQSTTLSIWRLDNQVAHQNHAEKITTLWQKTTQGKTRPVRLFDQYQRGIEYQPGEFKENGNDWDKKYQLVSASLIQQLPIESTEGEGCQQTIHYSGTINQRTYSIHWLAGPKLIGYYKESTPAGSVELSLTGIVADKAKVQQQLTDWLGYQTTDFADIGDNESDPFLRKMINLGFVEHGASGFYNAKGQAMEGKHNH